MSGAGVDVCVCVFGLLGACGHGHGCGWVRVGRGMDSKNIFPKNMFSRKLHLLWKITKNLCNGSPATPEYWKHRDNASAAAPTFF